MDAGETPATRQHARNIDDPAARPRVASGCGAPHPTRDLLFSAVVADQLAVEEDVTAPVIRPLDGNHVPVDLAAVAVVLYEFKGRVRTEATASQMTTGWKSMLLRAIDPLLKKDGAGVELPISITGTRNDFQFGLAMHDIDETPADMARDLKVHRQRLPQPRP